MPCNWLNLSRILLNDGTTDNANNTRRCAEMIWHWTGYVSAVLKLRVPLDEGLYRRWGAQGSSIIPLAIWRAKDNGDPDHRDDLRMFLVGPRYPCGERETWLRLEEAFFVGTHGHFLIWDDHRDTSATHQPPKI